MSIFRQTDGGTKKTYTKELGSSGKMYNIYNFTHDIALPKSHVYCHDFLHIVCGELIGVIRIVGHIYTHHTAQLHDLLMSKTHTKTIG